MSLISISGMLTGQWNVKPRWSLMVVNFVRQFQSSTQPSTSVLFSQATFYIFCSVLLYIQIYFNKVQPSYRLPIFTKINCQIIENPDKTASKKLLQETTEWTSSFYCQFTIFRQFCTLLSPHSNNKSEHLPWLWMFSKTKKKNWRLKSCKGRELTYKTAKRTETDVQNYPPWSAFLASLFAGKMTGS